MSTECCDKVLEWDVVLVAALAAVVAVVISC